MTVAAAGSLQSKPPCNSVGPHGAAASGRAGSSRRFIVNAGWAADRVHPMACGLLVAVSLSAFDRLTCWDSSHPSTLPVSLSNTVPHTCMHWVSTARNYNLLTPCGGWGGCCSGAAYVTLVVVGFDNTVVAAHYVAVGRQEGCTAAVSSLFNLSAVSSVSGCVLPMPS